MAERKDTLEKRAPPEKPRIRTRWLDGSKFVDLDDLGRSEVFRRTVEAARKIGTVHAQ